LPSPDGLDLGQGAGDVSVAFEVGAERRPAEVLRAAVGPFEEPPQPSGGGGGKKQGRNVFMAVSLRSTSYRHEWQK